MMYLGVSPRPLNYELGFENEWNKQALFYALLYNSTNTTAQSTTPLTMAAWETDDINKENKFGRSRQLGTFYFFVVSQQAKHSNELHVQNARAHDPSSTLAVLLKRSFGWNTQFLVWRLTRSVSFYDLLFTLTMFSKNLPQQSNSLWHYAAMQQQFTTKAR